MFQKALPAIISRLTGSVSITTYVFDTFTDTNATTLQTHTPDIDVVGTGWETTFAASMAVYANQADPQDNASTTGYSSIIDCGQGNVCVEGYFTMDGDNTAAGGLWIRQNNSNQGFFIGITSSGATDPVLHLYQWTGSYTSRDSVTMTGEGSLAGVHLYMRAWADGAGVYGQVIKDGVVYSVSYATSLYQANTYVGFRLMNAASDWTTIDNFSATDNIVPFPIFYALFNADHVASDCVNYVPDVGYVGAGSSYNTTFNINDGYVDIRSVSGGEQGLIFPHNDPGTNYDIEWRFCVFINTNQGGQYIQWNTDNANADDAIIMGLGDGAARLWKTGGGTGGITNTYSFTDNNATWYKMKLEVRGTDIEMFVDNEGGGGFVSQGTASVADRTFDIAHQRIGPRTWYTSGGYNGMPIYDYIKITAPGITEPINQLVDAKIAWWSLNETSGTRADSEGSVDLTDGATTGYATGKQGNAATFVEASANYLYYTSPIAAGIPTGAQSWSVAGWVKFSALPSSGDSANILAMADATWVTNANIDWRVFYNGTTGLLSFATVTGTTYYEIGIGSISTGVWYFVYAYHDQANGENGISLDDGTISTIAAATPNSGADELKMGRLAAGRLHYLDADLDEWVIFNRVLVPAEVRFLHASGAGVTHGDL